jgi:hypothetical protein
MQVVHADGVDARPARSPRVGTSADFEPGDRRPSRRARCPSPWLPPGNKLALAEVTAVAARCTPPPSTKPRTQIRDTIVSKPAQAKLLRDTTSQGARGQAAKATGGDLAKAAKAMGLDVKTYRCDFTRAGARYPMASASANYFAGRFSAASDRHGDLSPDFPCRKPAVVAKVVSQHNDAGHVPVCPRSATRSPRPDSRRQKARDQRNTLFDDRRQVPIVINSRGEVIKTPPRSRHPHHVELPYTAG